ncbi:MAG TPA: zinc-binding dehydrogenase, partial [Solirubrobacteraceae bacterium]|nr:zinc-binding dehydrogenase [Solirubrobacteraceae bacterium]
AGFMGNLIQKLAALRGPRELIVADTRADALERARALGATRTIDVRHESPAGLDADVTFEVTGVQAGLLAAGDATRMSGKLAIVGYHQGEPRAIPLGHWNWMAFQLLNAHFRDVDTIMRGMRTGMRLLTSSRLRLDDLVTHRFPLAQVNRAFAVAAAKPAGFVKATVSTSMED